MRAMASTMPPATEHVDVLIVGAGLSGIGAACHLRAALPNTTFAILEARGATGGTWDLFRYPGIRSDSDMFTLGYAFKPWEDAKAIADGPSILAYVREAAREHGVDDAIRLHHRVTRAAWSSDEARWTVEVERTDTGETTKLTCGFLFSCTGYFRYDRGHTPELPGIERFAGDVVHPQHWPADLDYAGRRVVVVGSGATAVTLVPAMGRDAAHVTMLQRSPSYVMWLPSRDPVADLLRRMLPRRAAYAAVRWKNILAATAFFKVSRRAPRLVRAVLRQLARRALPPSVDVDTHFRPRYDPWDQRVCFVPDGDLFRSLGTGRASIVTDRIATFTPEGIRLASGAELEADVVVTATGLEMLALGGIELVVDGTPVSLPDALAYRGMMLSDVPNFALALGYTNASWTLKCDLTCDYVCRLLAHMDEHGYVQATPRRPDDDLPTQPFLDLKSGYVQRSIDQFPQQGLEPPWRLYQNYLRDIRLLRRGALDDGILELRRRPAALSAPPPRPATATPAPG